MEQISELWCFNPSKIVVICMVGICVKMCKSEQDCVNSVQDCLNLQKIVHLYKSVQACVYLCQSAQVHTNLHEFVEICMGFCESE